MSIKAYLAGPDVFLEDAFEVGARKKQVCHKYGVHGIFPLDAEIAEEAAQTDSLKTCGDLSKRIYKHNIDLIYECDVVIANMTPFRGPSMDVGTAFEIGYACGQQIPIFGYSFDARPYEKRVVDFYRTQTITDYKNEALGNDPYGRAVENFELPENLMLVHCLEGFFDVSREIGRGNKVTPIHDDHGFDVVVGQISQKMVASRRRLRG